MLGRVCGVLILWRVGTRAYLYGGLLNNSDAEGDDFTIGWPTANYVTDGVPGESLNANASQSTAYSASHYRRVPNALL